MQPERLVEAAALLALLAPGLAFLSLGLFSLCERRPSERAIAAVTATAQILAVIGALVAFLQVYFGDRDAYALELGAWFRASSYTFELGLLLDRLSTAMMLLVAVIAGLIGRFSVTYMHRERGYSRFFLLLLLFSTAMTLLVSAGSIDLLFAGWELVGLSSFLLIAFFEERPRSVQSGLRAFVTYRACDIGLLLGAVLFHHFTRSAEFATAFGTLHWPLYTAHLSHGPATAIALLFVLAALGKSAQFPLSGWLPRAMEGPTPSSALFYGALSVHAGTYLLLRVSPLFDSSPEAAGLLCVIGLLTTGHGALTGRVQTDAKTALAYATVTQLGLIFAEIGLGLHRVAVVHMIGHAVVRSLQFLRAPSLLQDLLEVRALEGGGPQPHALTDALLRRLPPRLRDTLYGLSLQRLGLDGFFERSIVRPVLAAAKAIDAAERRFFRRLGSPPAEPVSKKPSQAGQADVAAVTAPALQSSHFGGMR